MRKCLHLMAWFLLAVFIANACGPKPQETAAPQISHEEEDKILQAKMAAKRIAAKRWTFLQRNTDSDGRTTLTLSSGKEQLKLVIGSNHFRFREFDLYGNDTKGSEMEFKYTEQYQNEADVSRPEDNHNPAYYLTPVRINEREQ